MAVSYETSALWKQALLLLLIATIPVSGLPLAKAHAHENAYAGHSHERSHFVDDHATRHDAKPHADSADVKERGRRGRSRPMVLNRDRRDAPEDEFGRGLRRCRRCGGSGKEAPQHERPPC